MKGKLERGMLASSLFIQANALTRDLLSLILRPSGALAVAAPNHAEDTVSNNDIVSGPQKRLTSVFLSSA